MSMVEMVEMVEIDPGKLVLPAVDLWKKQWLILTAGDQNDFNMMTVAWGSIGCMWHKPFVQIVVRPGRHTYQYLEKYDTFTLAVFPEEYRKDLQMMGKISGRDGDKLSQTGLTIRPSTKIDTPAYNEASLILECKIMYHQDMDPAHFEDDMIDLYYEKKDYHRIYFGEIIAAFQKRS